MKNLIHGIVDFRKKLTEENRALFAKLALGQKPDAFFIACSDSRVVPNLFASTNPGDLFVLRNVGNLIPPEKTRGGGACAQAALEFAVLSLKVADIIICGHSECGAMQALVRGPGKEENYLTAWLKNGQEALKKLEKGFIINPGLSSHNQLSQINVLQQISHILSYSFVQEKVEKKKLRVHGWWFDIAKAEVYCYEESLHQFVLIDEEESKLILQRLS